jgi:hypothetical protein
LKEHDCESVYCRELEQKDVEGPAAVPEFAQALLAGELELKSRETARKWLTTGLSENIRNGFYRLSQERLRGVLEQAEKVAGAKVQSVMTDGNGTAYFTELEPGTYTLANILPIELRDSLVSWNCEVQVKTGDIATEKPLLISNVAGKNVKCVAVEKPLPVCAQD